MKVITRISIGLVVLIGLWWACRAIIAYLDANPPPVEEESRPDWSPNGQQLAYTCALDGPTEGWTYLDRIVDIINPPSPDISWMEYSPGATNICIIDIDGHNHKRLTDQLDGERDPVWSPDGTQIAYLSRTGLYVMDADGQNQRRLVSGTIASDPFAAYSKVSWSVDGSQLLFSACLDTSNFNIYLVNVDDGSLKNLTPTSDRNNVAPRWIANQSQVFFLSSPRTALSYHCELDTRTYQMKIINVNGSAEQMIYRELFYQSVAISDNGQIAFVSDLVSKTSAEYAYNFDTALGLYWLNVGSNEPVEITTFSEPSVPSWSPAGRYLMFYENKVKIFDTQTGQIRQLPEMIPSLEPGQGFSAEFTIDNDAVWSPTGRHIATTGVLTINRSESEDHFISHESHIYLIDLQEDTIRRLSKK